MVGWLRWARIGYTITEGGTTGTIVVILKKARLQCEVTSDEIAVVEISRRKKNTMLKHVYHDVEGIPHACVHVMLCL